MADRRPMVPTEDALELALRDLSGAIDYPVGRDLAPIVGERIRRRSFDVARPSLGWRRPRLRLALVLAAALAVLVAAVVVAAVIGLPGIRIVFTEGPLPTVGPSAVPASPSAPASAPGSAAPSAPPSPSNPGPLGSRLGLGQPVDPTTVDAVAGRHVLVPATLGTPTSAFVDTSFGPPVITLVWRASPTLPGSAAAETSRQTGIGALLTEIPATVNEPYLEKVVGSGGTIERVTVGGHPGFWIAGAPHELVLLDPTGREIASTTRLVGSSLLWEQDGRTLRLESGLDREAAIAVGASVR